MGFLKDNKNRFLGDYDMAMFESSPQMEVFIDALLELFDILLERGPDSMYKLVSIDHIPDEYIDHLSALVGWRQTDHKFNFLTYRDLVKNIVRIYSIKGTQLSYDVFFRALGYDAKLYELWYDANGVLVRDKPVGAPDPTQSTQILNKSNYLEIEIDIGISDPAFPDPFGDNEFIAIILDYLNFLKPVHIRYKPILLDLPGKTDVPVIVEEGIPVIILGDYDTPSGVGLDGLFEDQFEGTINDNFVLFSSKDAIDCPTFTYNNSIRYGNSIARTIEYQSIQYPASIVQRPDVTYGTGCAPVPDELKFVIETDSPIGGVDTDTGASYEETLELRYNNYAYFDNQTGFDMEETVEIKDSIDTSSPQFSFGHGNLFEKP